MGTKRLVYILLLVAATSFHACEKTPKAPAQEKPSEMVRQADRFAQDLLGVYYLWNEEIDKDLRRLDPDTCRNPIPVVEEIRYHEGLNEVDHWTMMTDDLESFTSSVQGLGLTYGYELQAGRIANSQGNYFLIVCYVVKDGPAEKAGLKRGDIFLTINGGDITRSNINDALVTKSVTLGVSHLTPEGYLGPVERNVTLTAVDMWEDPVLVDKTFDVNGKKVGYLVYNSFDLKSSETLPDIFRQFKADGVEELILDLRYNGGGYVFTECALASLIAPYSNVAAGDVFQTEVYNSILSAEWRRQGYDTNTYFKTKHEMLSQGISVDVSDANPGLTKIYAIVTGGSASASEGVLVGLGPYMDITIIGEQTYGKYCAGWMLSPEDLYGTNTTTDYSKIREWGIYVMVSKFADKNGRNAAAPNGIPVDIVAEDNPLDGFQLGDEDETMLYAALLAAGKVPTKASTGARAPYIPMERLEHGAPRGILIKTDIPKVVGQF